MPEIFLPIWRNWIKLCSPYTATHSSINIQGGVKLSAEECEQLTFFGCHLLSQVF